MAAKSWRLLSSYSLRSYLLFLFVCVILSALIAKKELSGVLLILSKSDASRSFEKQLRNITSDGLQDAIDPVSRKHSESSTEYVHPAGLPSCHNVMSIPGSKLADGDFITRHTVPHKWTIRRDGSREFDLLSHCYLKRYAVEEARKCLAGQHVNFVGDSVSRYQYLSLAYFLERGSYPPRFTSSLFPQSPCREYYVDENNVSQCSPVGEPNVCSEADWLFHFQKPQTAWNKFHQAVGGGDDGGPFHGRMECQCALETNNMMYASEIDTKGDRLLLSYINERGWYNDIVPIQGFNFTGCAYNGTCRLDPATHQVMFDRHVRRSFDFIQGFPDAISPDKKGILLQLLPPVNISIYNRGLWGVLDPARAKSIFHAMFHWIHSSDGHKGVTGSEANFSTNQNHNRCFYKATTACRRDICLKMHAHELQPSIYDEAAAAGCSFLDYGHLTSDFGAIPYHTAKRDVEGRFWGERSSIYVDEIHFQPWVNEELNNVLLNVLCNGRTWS